MSRRRTNRLGTPARRASVALLLLLAAFAAALLLPPALRLPRGWLTKTARAQNTNSLADEYARLEKEGIEENAFRALCYRMLLPYLPTGTRMTSGYRSPEKQLDLIKRFAVSKGVPVPERMTVEDESSWRPAFNAIRARGIIIAAPTTTPHGTEEAVFDLSGAGLDSIRAGLAKAQDAGMIKYKRIIMEPRNNAVHVEVDFISPKALKVFSSRGGGSTTTAPPGSEPPRVGAGAAAPSVDEQRRILFQQTQELHDGEPDPLKKIDYDRSLRTMLDPAADAEKIRALDEEMESHQKEAEQQGAESSEKREAIVKVSEALRDGRLSDAERDAEEFAANFPGTKEARNMLAKIRVRRLVSDATEKMEVADCESCKEADELVREALKLSPRSQDANRLNVEVAACLSRCKARPVLAIVVGLFGLVGAASLAGWFLLSRPNNWFAQRLKGVPAFVLEGVEGACRGQTFPLDKERVVIGSKAPPEGTADIVILDPQRKISRQHCSIMRNGKQCYLLDESTNGTKINGYQVGRGATAVLNDGDQISLADVAVLKLTRR